jgi:cAMP-binding proteins - catabolite gene activator and regulatory subunit of cAMP-dependent protein kinases
VVRFGVEELLRLASTGEGALALLQLFCRRISALEEKVAELAFASVRTRLGLLLLSLAREGMPQADGSVVCYQYPTHEEMARRIGTTREQVTSLLAQFRRSGAVAYRRKGPLRIFPDRVEQQIEAP